MYVCMFCEELPAIPNSNCRLNNALGLLLAMFGFGRGGRCREGVVGVATFYGGVVALGEGMRGIPVATTPLHRVGDNPFGLSIAWLFVTAPLKALSTAEPALEFATTNNIQSGVTISIKQ